MATGVASWQGPEKKQTARLGTRRPEMKVHGQARSVKSFVLPVDPYHRGSMMEEALNSQVDKMTSSSVWDGIATLAGLEATVDPMGWVPTYQG